MKLTRHHLRKLIKESVNTTGYLEKAKKYINEWNKKISTEPKTWAAQLKDYKEMISSRLYEDISLLLIDDPDALFHIIYENIKTLGPKDKFQYHEYMGWLFSNRRELYDVAASASQYYRYDRLMYVINNIQRVDKNIDGVTYEIKGSEKSGMENVVIAVIFSEKPDEHGNSVRNLSNYIQTKLGKLYLSPAADRYQTPYLISTGEKLMFRMSFYDNTYGLYAYQGLTALRQYMSYRTRYP
jgi:hypothetical protein